MFNIDFQDFLMSGSSKSCNLPTWEEAYKMFLRGGDNWKPKFLKESISQTVVSRDGEMQFKPENFS